jgi:holo-[acyl-carrier protein] synthase
LSGIITTGTDIIEISRIKDIVSNWKTAFLNRVYTPQELEICNNSPARLAGRFAAKEAVLKAINPRQTTWNWREIEILATPEGRPTVSLSGNILIESKKRGIRHFDVSISHCRDYAIAVAVAQC